MYSCYSLRAIVTVAILIDVCLSTDSDARVRKKETKFPPPQDDNYDYSDERNNQLTNIDTPVGFLSPSVQEYLELGKAIPGRPGTDYPVLGTIPYTNFYCDNQPFPGFFADPETRCQSWHYCDIDGRQTTFLCPNGTQFNQFVFSCDWWFNVRCELSKKLYLINARLYGRPKVDPAQPHRSITRELLENIFNDE
ncbi:uncharacterized protein LOC108738646 [Agrilus planipennis]|uniref:Uncharacterized protein LOC108738646 n=1 Tax=Agrilus planipennis TaxID=224129 RepID=A0A1W4WUT7_AGRPL|nr:uncharacterized protein LOC108738646 [Agrilus planipennis]